ncbi:MAG: hypothetical protein ABH883_01150 [Candidatus Omnitrophota bacterium]
MRKLKNITKLYFGYKDISVALGITDNSAKVTANRYVESGYLVRVKRNVYVLSEKWEYLEKEEKFLIANIIQVPSYISLMTALDYYEITTQIQRGFIESISIKRTKESEINGLNFVYSKINKRLYFGFEKKQDFFIASPEKAFLDALYLMSLGRYKLDISSIDMNKLDKGKISALLKVFPKKTERIYSKYGYSEKT